MGLGPVTGGGVDATVVIAGGGVDVTVVCPKESTTKISRRTNTLVQSCQSRISKSGVEQVFEIPEPS